MGVSDLNVQIQLEGAAAFQRALSELGKKEADKIRRAAITKETKDMEQTARSLASRDQGAPQGPDRSDSPKATRRNHPAATGREQGQGLRTRPRIQLTEEPRSYHRVRPATFLHAGKGSRREAILGPDSRNKGRPLSHSDRRKTSPRTGQATGRSDAQVTPTPAPQTRKD